MIGRLGSMLGSIMMAAMVWAGLTVYCSSARRSVYLALDGRLALRRTWQVRMHMAMCKRCFSRYEFARLLRRIGKKQITAPRAPRALLIRIRKGM